MLTSQCLLALFFLGGICELADAQLTQSSGAREPSNSPVARVMAEPSLALAAMQAELAWLGDPVSFACDLEIAPNGPGLEARGWVSDEAVRAHVLQVACEASGAQVSDSLHIDPARTIRPMNTPSVSLRRAALSAINQALPSRAYDINLETWGNGQVVLEGKVETYEERLLASRCMRHVQGCTCVLNRLSVKQPYASAGRSRQDSISDAHTDSAVKPASLRVDASQASSTSSEEIAISAERAGSQTAISISASNIAPDQPESGNWAQNAARRVKRTISRICSWRPRFPRLFGPSPCTYEECLGGSTNNPTMAVSAWTPVTVSRPRSPYSQLDPSPNRIEPIAAVQASPPMHPEPRKLDFAGDDAVMQAAAHSCEANKVGRSDSIGQKQLRELIVSSCGEAATSVEVSLQSEELLDVRIRAASLQVAEGISDRVLRLAELKPYHVSLTISSSP
jgi:osmotically-inducible protein OsmY